MVLQLFSANCFVLYLDSFAELREKKSQKYGENEPHLLADLSIKIVRIYTAQNQ